eukprot:CAMPEP_0119132466 /NCGR_PEP_ID=MMETSP1310-20130426/11854_1 /TAXON_ID=464262 /ORGANISM="Genus nov. species nov., Strain RCC2339" /LENGTH=74 /DNA_ID=CAMNT_0007123103 /DNA_START=79 /DNA_END=300 /DNA_ORIENTATION=-
MGAMDNEVQELRRTLEGFKAKIDAKVERQRAEEREISELLKRNPSVEDLSNTLTTQGKRGGKMRKSSGKKSNFW